MRVLFYGAGAIGSLLAGKLAIAGYDVTVLARGSRLEELAAGGIELREASSGHTEKAAVRLIDRLAPDDVYDYVFVVMQMTQVGAVLPALSANRSGCIAFIVNNPDGYDEWVRAVGPERLVIGFPSAGGERRDGIVHYFIGRGLARTFQTTTFGEYSGEITRRLKTLLRMFRRAGIPAASCRSMDAWQKTHVAVVTAIANALYGHGSDNYALAKSGKDVLRMAGGMQEGLLVLAKLGYGTTPAKLLYLRLLPRPVLAAVFQIVMNTKMAEVAMARHTVFARDEMRALQRRFDVLIARSGLTTPCIDELRKNL